MSEIQQSLPEALFRGTLEAIVTRFGLVEQAGEDGGPWMTLASQLPMVQGSVGNVRLFTGAPLFRLVTCSLTVAPMQLDSHMLFAFTPGNSPLPHFTLDSVKAGEHFAFHLDLIPRLDLGANLAYMDSVFQPLTEVFEAARDIEGLSRAHLSPRQLAVMSPWMLAHRADASAFQAIEGTVQAYREHWCGLVEAGIPAEVCAGVSGEALQARNLANKAMLFSPEIDPVWQRIEGLIGAEAVAAQRALLLGDDE
ncbi:hypothetical protein [Haliea sp. E17]|uniref:hypothetical protein n=1 Tax=Haliea sp. E17 TaxID=3401576 RepID=UPI003AAE7D04